MTDTGTNVPPTPENAFAFAVSASHTACPSPPTFALKFDLLETQWSDILEDNNGVATSIFGIEFEDFSSKQLRVICSKLNIKGIHNAKKPEMVEHIVKSHKNKKAYNAMMTFVDSKLPLEERGISNRKQIQYPFRLLDVLFSDDFVEDFATLGNASSWQLLDSGKADNQQHFLERVSVAYKEQDDIFGKLHILEDEIISEHSNVDPSKVVPHE